MPPSAFDAEAQPAQPEAGLPTSTPAMSAPKRSGILRAFSALHQRNYRLYFCGQFVSVMGTWMQTVGQAWLVYQLTNDPLQLGIVGALQLLPVLLFSLGAGVLVDRWPKRRVLLCTQSAAALQALALWLLVVTGSVQLWEIYLLAFLLGLTSCLDQPAKQAFVIEMVGREDLTNAVGLNAALTNLARILGPSIGGALIAASGVALLFLLNGVSYLAVLLALVLIDPRKLFAQPTARGAGEAPPTLWQSLREGLVYLWRTPVVFLPMVVTGLTLLFGSNFNVVLPVIAQTVLHDGAQGYGFLSGGFGAGSLVGALALASGKLQPTNRRVLVGGLVFTCGLALFALSRVFPLSLVLVALLGLMETLYVEMALIQVQMQVPDALRGRAMSVMLLFLDGSVPFGYLLMGGLSAAGGAPFALLVGAAGCLVVLACGWVWLRKVEGRASVRTSPPALP